MKRVFLAAVFIVFLLGCAQPPAQTSEVTEEPLSSTVAETTSAPDKLSAAEAEQKEKGAAPQPAPSATAQPATRQPCTPVSCGTLRVKVLDSFGMPVPNATVAIYNASTGFLAVSAKQFSNSNGEAKFLNVPSGNYYAFAFKNNDSTKSQTQSFDSTSLNEENPVFTVRLGTASQSLIRIQALDRYDNPVPFTTIEIFDAQTGEKLAAAISNEQGIFDAPISAPVVYVKLSKEGFLPYFSAARYPSAGYSNVFQFQLQPYDTFGEAKISFIGLFDSGRQVSALQPNKSYHAIFQLNVPANKNYSEVGMHVRTGKNKLMENDGLFIASFSAPNASIFKSRLYDEDSGLDAPQYSPTEGDAKWANAVWLNPQAGTYEALAVVSTLPNISAGTPLNLDYRAWAVTGGTRFRDPPDDLVESFELYSNIYTQNFSTSIGTTAAALCKQDICFEYEIVDLQDALAERNPFSYQAKIFNRYLLKFALTNGSEEYFTNAELRVANRDRKLTFINYTIFDAESQTFAGAANSNELPRIDAGVLRPGSKLTASIDFQPVASGATLINIRLVADQQIAFEKNISIQTSAAKQMRLDIPKAKFPANLESDLTVTVTDRSTSEPLRDALVKLTDKFGNTILSQTTGPSGKVTLRIPARPSGTILRVEANLANYEIASGEIQVV